MTDKDCAPLSTACVKALQDKIYDKRKNAAFEIEKMVKEFAVLNNTNQIKKLLSVLNKFFILSQNICARKGGLHGMAAVANGLGKDTSLYLQDIVKPILSCFLDQDSRVRYCACESLYNVTKVSRGSILQYFNIIFDSISKLVADTDQTVKAAVETTDKILKDIVVESSSFDIVGFIPLLRERIYSTNPFARQFVVSWISVLDSVPDIDMLVFLPELLDGLINILSDPTPELRSLCETLLAEQLKQINKNPGKVDFASLANILINHAQSPDQLLQMTAFIWLNDFVRLAGEEMLPFVSGILVPGLMNLESASPSLSSNDIKNGGKNDDMARNIIETAKSLNNNLMRLISSKQADGLKERVLGKVQPELLALTGSEDSSKSQLDLSSVVEVLTKHLNHESVATRTASLLWIQQLHEKVPVRLGAHLNTLFPILLKCLCDPDDQVVVSALRVLAEVSSSPHHRADPAEDGANSAREANPYFMKFLVSILGLFSQDNKMLEFRGPFIIRQLCVLVSPEDIYKSLSAILYHEADMKFAALMVQTLNTILLTSSELFNLRVQLKDLRTKDTRDLFCSLYKTWCHHPVATVALCLLSQKYDQASQLVQVFADLDITVDLLVELDKLVQLIESPIFTYLRLHLLDTNHNQALLRTLYGLLMLLPQSDAFHMLRHRLQCVPSIPIPPPSDQGTGPAEDGISASELKLHFLKVQQRHKMLK